MQPPIVGCTIVRLFQTPAEPAGVWVKEFGQAYWMNLIGELDDGRYIQIGEYEWQPWQLGCSGLIAAKLTQEEYSLSDVEGQRIDALQDVCGEFAVVLNNRLGLRCVGGPGGNQPWIHKADSPPED